MIQEECLTLTQLRTQMKQEKKKKSTFRRFMKITVITMLLLIITVGAGFAYVTYKVHDVTSTTNQELDRGDRSEYRVEAVSPDKDNISILFLGVDDRNGDLSGRTDAMVLATFNQEEGTVKMLNIPRDSRVDIPGRQNLDKINHAHAFGGVDLTVETVENLLDIPVDYFVTLDFTAFMEVIDTFGGVEVDVPFTFSEMNSRDQANAITVNEGLQKLDGEEALAFVRTRRNDNDLQRGERQKQVLEALIKEAASLSSITRFSSVMDSIEDHMRTNLSFGNIVSLHSYSSGLDEIDSLSIDGSDSRINGIYYYDLNPESKEEISSKLRSHLDVEDSKDDETSLTENIETN